VQVRALTDKATAPATTTASAAPPRNGFSIISEAEAGTLDSGDAPAQQFFIQVGAFGDSDNAVKLVARLRHGGVANSFIVSSTEGRDQLHRVRVGPLANPAEFDRVGDDLRELGLTDLRLVIEN